MYKLLCMCIIMSVKTEPPFHSDQKDTFKKTSKTKMLWVYPFSVV